VVVAGHHALPRKKKWMKGDQVKLEPYRLLYDFENRIGHVRADFPPSPKWEDPDYCPDHDPDFEPEEVTNMREVVRLFTSLDRDVREIYVHESDMVVRYSRERKKKWVCCGPSGAPTLGEFFA
jgi:hypothetical protein